MDGTETTQKSVFPFVLLEDLFRLKVLISSIICVRTVTSS